MVGQPRESPGSYAPAVVCVAWPVRVARVGGVGTALRVDARVDRNRVVRVACDLPSDASRDSLVRVGRPWEALIMSRLKT